MSQLNESLKDQEFGDLTVIDVSHTDKICKYWLCKCSCGKIVKLSTSDLRYRGRHDCGHSSLEKRRYEFGQSCFNALHRAYKAKSKKENIDWNLSEGQFKDLINKNCHYCSIEPNQIYQRKGYYGHIVYNGIDRVDNNKGYTIDNCVPCCKKCNYGKRDMSLDEFLSWIYTVYNTSINNVPT